MSGRKVEIWFQPGPSEKPVPDRDGDIPDEMVQNRIRLVTVAETYMWQPGKDGSRFYGDYSNDEFASNGRIGLPCCWARAYCANLKALKIKMHDWDKKQGFPRAIKIGEFYE